MVASIQQVTIETYNVIISRNGHIHSQLYLWLRPENVANPVGMGGCLSCASLETPVNIGDSEPIDEVTDGPLFGK